MDKNQPQLRGTKRDFGIETRNLLDIDYKEIKNNNVKFVIKFNDKVVGIGYTGLLNKTDLKKEGGNTDWNLVPSKIPTYMDHEAIIKWFDETESKYKVGQYLDSLNIKKWAENIWYNVKQQKYLDNPESNIFKNANKQSAFKKVEKIKESFDNIWYSL